MTTENNENQNQPAGIAPKVEHVSGGIAPQQPQSMPSLTYEQYAEYQQLKQQIAQQQRQQQEAAQAQAKAETAAIYQQLNEAKLEALLAKQQVPDELKGIIPGDYEKAEQFLGSDHYKSIVDALVKTKQPPTPPETDAPAEQKQQSAVKAPKTFADFTYENHLEVGKALTALSNLGDE